MSEASSSYDAALALITRIDDEGYRRVATEAVILERVKRDQGFNDPGGELAMRLRRDAKESFDGR